MGHLKARYYRFKSNPKTVVRAISDRLVRIVWSDESRLCHTWCIYSYDEANLIPLTEAEAQTADEKIRQAERIPA